MIPKIDDYIRYYDSACKKEMFAWVDGVNKDFSIVMIQCDDCWNGYRGTSCSIDNVVEVLPKKTRPLSYYKTKLCFGCQYNSGRSSCCDYSTNVYCTDKHVNCPYKMEFAVLEGEAKELA